MTISKLTLAVFFLMCVPHLIAAQKRIADTKLDNKKMKASFPMAEIESSSSTPKSASIEHYLPPVGEQGNSNASVGWSSAYYALSTAFFISADSAGIKLPKEHAFDPLMLYYTSGYFNDKEWNSNISISEGLLELRDNDNAIKKVNINAMVEDTVIPSGKNIFDLVEAYYLFDSGDAMKSKIDAVRCKISKNRPVIIAMNATESFFNIGADGLLVNKTDEENFGAISLCVVGFDDEKFGGAFRVVNSWGTSWGDKGFAWIKYDDFSKLVDEAYYLKCAFRSPLKSVGCVFGNCENGYGVKKINGKDGAIGLYEGYFDNSKVVEGIYYTPTASRDKKVGEKYISTTIKKSKGNAIEIKDGSRKAGFVLKN
ncbi:MAG: C1 family peptidase [Bacteroidota bacterium]